MKTSKKILAWLTFFYAYSALSQNAQKTISENTVSDISSTAYGLRSPDTMELKSSQEQTNALLTVENNNSGFNQNLVNFISHGTNSTLRVDNIGKDENAGSFTSFNDSNLSPMPLSKSYGIGGAPNAYAYGTGRAQLIQASNATNINEALLSLNTGGGPAGIFTINNTSNSRDALKIESNGTGNAIWLNQSGSGSSSSTENNIAISQSQGINRARIDKDGIGYFNGGTQNSGADVTEAFEVESDCNPYKPGDVLVISTKSDRKVEKSIEPYSSVVAGVYATKPGVLLTEENMHADLSQHVPMDVIGVIPTKVCNANGAVKRGDLLVTSSKTGYSMKVDLSKVSFGQINWKSIGEF